jgi:sec-independent protein translocase protein TatC
VKRLERTHDADEELSRMGLFDHLVELRQRLGRAALAFFASFFLCWGFSDQIYSFLARPIYAALKEGEKLVFLNVMDPFIIQIKVAALAAIFLSSPLVLYQVWAFIAPGLYRREKFMAVPFIFFGARLFLAGGAFAYFVAFPFAVEFLLGVGTSFEAQITITSYLSFLMTVILGLGLMFELPTVIVILARLGLVTPRFLLRNVRYAIVLIFIAAAVITPTPDVFNLCIFALPTVALYFLGIGMAWIFTPKEKKEAVEG